MRYNNTFVIKVTDEMKENLQQLAETAECRLSTFIRGQLEMSLWLWNEKSKDGRFNSLWNEFCYEKQPLNKKLRGE